MQLRQTRLLIIFFVLIIPSAYCQIGGTSTYNFLELPVSARAAAMGGNYISVRDGDLSLAADNPSFLDSSVDRHLVMTYVPFIAGIQYGFASYAETFKNIGTFDAGLKYVSYGTFTQADVSGNIIGTFSAADYMLNIGYGRPMLDSLISVGGNLKLITSNMAQYYSIGAAIDLAGSYISKNRRFFAALLVQNVGTEIKNYTPGNPEALPFDIQAGLAVKLAHAPFRFNLTIQHLQQWTLTYLDPTDTATVNSLTGQPVAGESSLTQFADNLMRHFVPGVEVLLGKNFALRLAYNYERRQELKLEANTGLIGFSGGFEIKIYKFQISYALASYNLAGASNTFTIGINLADFVPHKAPPADVSLPLPGLSKDNK
jgi:hypothetical protein